MLNFNDITSILLDSTLLPKFTQIGYTKGVPEFST